MRHKLFRSIPFLLLTLALAGCGSSTVTLRSPDGAETVSVNVEVADSPKEHEKGLMGRTSLDPETGMLFVFKEPNILRFWMKDTKIPLDILFFDEGGSFVNYLAMDPCTSDPCTIYPSAALSSYALEVNKGFRDQHKIGVGWSINVDQIRKISRPS